MKAVTYSEYGGVEVLQYQEVELRSLQPNEVLINIHAASVNPIDWKIRNGMARWLTGWRKPKNQILGADISGEIEAIGEGVETFKVGQEVYAILGAIEGGGYAEKVITTVDRIAQKPQNMSSIEAAAVPLAGLTAYQALQQGGIYEGANVLINGASGGVGVYAVQLAKALGANVTAVCSERNVQMVQELGADAVINYEVQDFTQSIQQFDIIFDVVGLSNYYAVKDILAEKGAYITTIPHPKVFLLSKWLSFTSNHRVIPFMTQNSGADLEELQILIEKGKLRSIIDHTFPLENAAAAQDYSETGRARGKIVIKMS